MLDGKTAKQTILTIAALMGLSACVAAPPPPPPAPPAVHHPAYLHALSDLRAARWLIEHRPGAGGLIGTTYLGEVAPKDGTVFGHLTGTSWRYANNPEAFRIDFMRYEFIANQPSTAVYFARTDVSPRPRSVSATSSTIDSSEIFSDAMSKPHWPRL